MAAFLAGEALRSYFLSSLTLFWATSYFFNAAFLAGSVALLI
jgi:hypothetical protein